MPRPKNTNIREIARRAGVSVASVSRALRPDQAGRVSPQLREKILAVCEEFRYAPNAHSVRLFTRRANTVAFFAPPECMHVPNLAGTPDFNLTATLGGAEQVFARHSIYVTIATLTKSFIDQKEYLKFPRGKMVDGILIWGRTRHNPCLLELLEEEIPLVAIQSTVPPISPNIPNVAADDYGGMQRIVKHVLSLGHRKLAFIPPKSDSRAGQERQRAVRDTCAEQGVSLYESRTGGFEFQHGIKATEEILAGQPKTTCIIAANDMVAFGVLAAMRQKKLRVPEDISVTGADGLFFPGHHKLTTYSSPSFDLGAESANLLLQLINGEKWPTTSRILPVTFIPGDTCAPPPEHAAS